MAELNVNGNCFEAAFNAMIEEHRDALLVHGIVQHQQHPKIRYAHAWLELDNQEFVVDRSNGRDIKMPRHLYYVLGQIHEWQCMKYSFEEAASCIVDYEHYGPWHISDGLDYSKLKELT